MINRTSKRKNQGFSLLELVIVITIIAIIAAIAIPRMSRGTAGASDSALAGDLAVMRNGIDMYAVEHNGAFPAVATFVDQLTLYTDAAGDTDATQDATHIYGPYIRKVTPLPVGAKRNSTGVAATDSSGVGWIYNATTGAIQANTTSSEKDATGTLYSAY